MSFSARSETCILKISLFWQLANKSCCFHSRSLKDFGNQPGCSENIPSHQRSLVASKTIRKYMPHQRQTKQQRGKRRPHLLLGVPMPDARQTLNTSHDIPPANPKFAVHRNTCNNSLWLQLRYYAHPNKVSNECDASKRPYRKTGSTEIYKVSPSVRCDITQDLRENQRRIATTRRWTFPPWMEHWH